MVRPYSYNYLSYPDVLTDEDILLELKAGDTRLGRWRFKNAVVAGIVQTVTPIKVPDEPPASHKEGYQT